MWAHQAPARHGFPTEGKQEWLQPLLDESGESGEQVPTPQWESDDPAEMSLLCEHPCLPQHRISYLRKGLWVGKEEVAEMTYSSGCQTFSTSSSLEFLGHWLWLPIKTTIKHIV